MLFRHFICIISFNHHRDCIKQVGWIVSVDLSLSPPPFNFYCISEEQMGTTFLRMLSLCLVPRLSLRRGKLRKCGETCEQNHSSQSFSGQALEKHLPHCCRLRWLIRHLPEILESHLLGCFILRCFWPPPWALLPQILQSLCKFLFSCIETFPTWNT